MQQKDRLHQRRQAHQLKPIILIGQNGLTDAVHDEIERALNDHELIKVQIAGATKIDCKQQAEIICKKHQAALIQSIGHCIAIYRKQVK